MAQFSKLNIALSQAGHWRNRPAAYDRICNTRPKACTKFGQKLICKSNSLPYRLVKEIGCVKFIFHCRDEGCLGACQAGPVQALEPGMQLDLPSPFVAQPVTGVQPQQPIH